MTEHLVVATPSIIETFVRFVVYELLFPLGFLCGEQTKPTLRLVDTINDEFSGSAFIAQKSDQSPPFGYSPLDLPFWS